MSYVALQARIILLAKIVCAPSNYQIICNVSKFFMEAMSPDL
jgi:hypothetical protein